MKLIIQLQVQEPCHENWNHMTATQQGRFCISCSKEVIDFSVMTDKEILAHIAKSTEKMCGRFCGNQLNRDLTTPAEPRKIWWKYWMSVAASVVMLTSKSNAQNVKLPNDTMVAMPPTMKPDQVLEGRLGGMIAVNNDYYKKNYTITGMIKDENNNPVFGATVMIKDTKKGVASDANGAFTIRINDSKNVVLHVSYVGYETQDVKIDNRTMQSSVNINVKLTAMVQGLMGDVVITRVKKRSLFNYFKKDSVKIETPLAKQALTIYPNPVIKGTDIKMSIDNLQEGNYRLSVYDVMGNLVAGKEIKITGSNVKESLLCDQRFAGGIYVISLTGNGKTISSKCIVQ